ncbi:MAG: hypothetical protein DRG87_09820 [Deltaproteobacteria bacterium]|nr:MAG: hypothetical protein DRG87_09820 [Deltaproteobacteria bacterium]
MEMKYKSLKELKEALDKGEIQANPANGDCLIVDSDSIYFYLDDECVFRMHPSDLLEEALDLLGIPWENA